MANKKVEKKFKKYIKKLPILTKIITMYVGGSYTEPSLNDAIECIRKHITVCK